MYKLLIVDDEELEREGMAKLIPWGNYDIELADTAWNGVEGLEKIRKYQPDIVLTDIKMPVMDGIELIRRTRKEYPDIKFIVLSGYGEYEYTSQAMEEGVRHYILKPCDEAKIVNVIDKVKASIEEQCHRKEQLAQYDSAIRTLLPRAKEQVFYNLLMGREQIQADYRLFMEELDETRIVRVLSIRLGEEIDSVVQFVLHNILDELLEKDILLLQTAFADEMVFLLSSAEVSGIRSVVRRMGKELKRLAGREMRAALSEAGPLAGIRALYLQTAELFCMDESEGQEILLTYELFKEAKEGFDGLIDYAGISDAKDMESILLELYLLSCKMKIHGYSGEKKRKTYQWIRKVFSAGQPERNVGGNLEADGNGTEWEMIKHTAEFMVRRNQQENGSDQEEDRMDRILLAVFEHLSDPEMNIGYLAREVLYMNEDYFGRLFQRRKRVKFSPYVLGVRIELAKRLIRYSPDIRVSEVAGLVGFPEDGQYFSRVFRNVTGVSPSQYKNQETGR